MKRFLIALIIFCSCFCASANDVLQWRGNDRSGNYPEKNLMKSWGEGEPKMLWANSEIGAGFSGPAVQGDLLYITGLSADRKRELLFALNRSGKILWTLDYAAAFEPSFTDARLMPTIVENYVYLLSGCGEIVCIDLKKKSIKWRVNAIEKYSGKPRGWGYAENLVVYDGKVFFTCGGDESSVVALDAKSGETVWKSKSLHSSAAYFSPIIIERNSRAQIVCGLIGYAFGVDVKSGEILWTKKLEKLGVGGFEQEKTWETNVAMPIYKDGWLFIISGNNYGCYMLELPEWKGEPKVVWQTGDFDTHHGGDILYNGRIYGSTWVNNEKGDWACYEWQTGKKIYNETWKGHSKGSIVMADGMLYCYDEKRGEIALVNPNSDFFDVVSTLKISLGQGKHWCHPVIADGVMYVRRGSVLMAFDLRKK